MLKIKKITLSGFRGILKPQELNLLNGGKPNSLVVFGLNSSGKSSFVDGLEWFLSENNEIEWLKRENAESRAYPHQEAKNEESFVEIEFDDENNKSVDLTKSFDHSRITKPILSSESDFVSVYKSFVIRPYLRYLEIIDFVFNRTGLEKYQKLANWMGFEKELAFQEKIALKIIPELRRNEEKLKDNAYTKEFSVKMLIGHEKDKNELVEKDVLNFCIQLLNSYKEYSFISMTDLDKNIADIDSLKFSSARAQRISNLTRIELDINSITIDDNLLNKVDEVQSEINDFTKKKEIAEKIDYINLYKQASDILDKTDKQLDEQIGCPLCGNQWKREELIKHIKHELELLQEAKEAQDKITESIKKLKLLIEAEKKSVNKLLNAYDELKKIIPEIIYDKATSYSESLELLESSLSKSIFDIEFKSLFEEKIIENIKKERETIKLSIADEKTKTQPSPEEAKRNEDIEKVKKINTEWREFYQARKKLKFYKDEIAKFVDIASQASKKIQDNITGRFKQISALIGDYFGILRNDKDIKDIEITLNQDKGRAAGRSAEIQLSYYNISVKPAYKVLSESLLNSLGLAVYFACIKQFNTESKFIVLDDIMNSLDVGHRDTLLDLIHEKLSDYQVILFTHDLYWFEKIQRRFPQWIHKKIKSWDYITGPNIDSAKNTTEEIKELLKDATKAEDAGSKFGKYVEGTLNELCEDIQAELKYRYTRNDPPTLEELFNALGKRLKDKLTNHPVVEKVKNAQKYEPILRNATTHPRQNYPSGTGPQEVIRAMDEWLKVEDELFCAVCKRYVQYKQDSGKIECRCGQKKLERVS